MNTKDLASLLDGRECGKEITKEEEAQAKESGLVVVFGYSDDGVSLCGAIHEEVGAWEGITFRVCADGLLPEFRNVPSDEDETEAYFKRKLAGFKEITAIWSPDETTSWAYSTEIPHEVFNVMEDGEVYCRGIVFAIADVKP